MTIKVTCSVNKETVKVGDDLMVSGTVTKDGVAVSRGTVHIYVNKKLWGNAVSDRIGTWFLEKTVTSPPFNPDEINKIHAVYSEVGVGYGDCYTSVYVESAPIPNEFVNIINIDYEQNEDIVKIIAYIECSGEKPKYISPFFAFALSDYAGLGQLADFKRKGYYKGGKFIEGDFVPADFTGTVVAEYKLREKTNWIQKEPTYGWGFGLSKGDISLAKKYKTAVIKNPYYKPSNEKVEIKSLSYEQVKDIVVIKAKVKSYGEKQKYISPHFEMAIDNYHNYKKCAVFSDKGYITMFGAQKQTEFLPADFEGTVYAKYFIKDFPPNLYRVEPQYCFAFGTRKGDISLGKKCDTAKIENPFYTPEPKKLQISVSKNTVKPYEDFTIAITGEPRKQVKIQVKYSGILHKWEDTNISKTLDSSGKATVSVHFTDAGTYNIRAVYTDSSAVSNEVEIKVIEPEPKRLQIFVDSDRKKVGEEFIFTIKGKPNSEVRLCQVISFYLHEIMRTKLDSKGEAKIAVKWNYPGRKEVTACYTKLFGECAPSIIVTVLTEEEEEPSFWDLFPEFGGAESIKDIKLFIQLLFLIIAISLILQIFTTISTTIQTIAPRKEVK